MVLVTSSSNGLFSIHADRNAAVDINSAIDDFINNTSTTTTSKSVVTVYSGLCTGTTFSAFASSNYRLATSTTHLIIKELLDGSFPTGGLAHHMCKNSPSGMAVARYAAVSGRPLMALDLYNLGLVTHIVEKNPQVHLCEALAHTVPDRPINPGDKNQTKVEKKIVFGDDESGDIADDNSWSDHTTSTFGKVIVDDALDDLLNTMHVADPIGSDGKAIDIMSDKLWDKLLLVKPIANPYDPYIFSADVTTDDVGDSLPKEDMESIENDIVRIFSIDNIDECTALLEKEAGLGKDWARKALVTMTRVSRERVMRWWTVTRAAEEGAAFDDEVK